METSSLQVRTLCTGCRTWSQCRHTSPKRCQCSIGTLRPPTASGDREQDDLASAIHGRTGRTKRIIWQSSRNNSLNTCSTYSSETLTRTGCNNTTQQSSKRLYWICSCMREAARVQTKMRQLTHATHTQNHAAARHFHTKTCSCASHLSALICLSTLELYRNAMAGTDPAFHARVLL